MPLDQTYLQVSDGNGDAALMHVTDIRAASATTIEVDTVANVPNKFIATYGTLLASGFIDPTTAVNFYGHLSGSDLEIDGFLAGSVDAGNAVGDVVVIRPNTFWADLIAATLIALPGGNIVDGSIEGPKLAADVLAGWIDANESWAYASATTITVPAGAASKYSIGDKIKLTQTTVKYFYVIGVSDTLLTVTGGSDYTVADAAITSPFYSKALSPVGFPQWFTYTPTMDASGGSFALGNGSLTGKFQLVGKTCHMTLEYAHGSSGVNAGSGYWRWTMPIVPYETALTISNISAGSAYIEDFGSVAYHGTVKFSGYNTGTKLLEIIISNNASIPSQAGRLTGTSPFTFASQDFIAFFASYQIA